MKVGEGVLEGGCLGCMGDRSYYEVVLFVHWFVRAGEGWGDVSVELP